MLWWQGVFFVGWWLSVICYLLSVVGCEVWVGVHMLATNS
ncbi:hypothetical protein FLAVO9AF_10202 [Flavobacterium sp. 9AF]|nr:hypothetical protein FLAVO9AF_10202 [Flavobacterium sp. 9AF]